MLPCLSPLGHVIEGKDMIDLFSLAKSANEAISFVTGQAFLAALDAIGGVHMQAAQDAFRKVPQSQNPREAMNRALCHLEAAHVAFRGSWSTLMARYLRPVICLYQASKDVYTCCFIALIHRLLGDDDRLVIQAIRLAEEAFAVAAPGPPDVPRLVLYLVNPLNAIDALYLDDKYEGIEVRHSDFEGFKKLILDSSSGELLDDSLWGSLRGD